MTRSPLAEASVGNNFFKLNSAGPVRLDVSPNKFQFALEFCKVFDLAIKAQTEAFSFFCSGADARAPFALGFAWNGDGQLASIEAFFLFFDSAFLEMPLDRFCTHDRI
jgi:hypothetical protein